MSMHASLTATKRDGTGKGTTRKLRSSGRIPAVVYGGESEATSLTLNALEATKVFSSVSAESAIIDLSIDGAAPIQTLVREIQTHPFRNEIMHIDFLRVTRGVAVDLEVPLHLVGTPVGVRVGGGLLEHLVHSVSIRCIPSLIPDAAELDVSELELGAVLHVSDLRLPEGVQILSDPSLPVCTVAGTRAGASEAGSEG